MEFRKELHIPASGIDVDFSDGIMLIGSCFAENMSKLLEDHRFSVNCNPHGILFNPTSILRALEDIISNRQYTSEDLLCHDSKFISMQHHGRFNAATIDEALQKINNSIARGHDFLRSCSLLIITWGSSHAWKFLPTGEIIANCHRLSQEKFEKTLIEHASIESDYTLLFQKLRAFNPKLKIVLTVSPVRYYRDGIIASNISKSHLIIAAHALSKSENTYYFPAYEYIVDDLRDYRFFKEDMTHPGEQAIGYVWEKFLNWAMKALVVSRVNRITALLKGLGHRSENQKSVDEGKRRDAILAEIEKIKRE